MKWTIMTLVTLLLQHGADLAYAETQFESPYYYPTDITKGICSNDSSQIPSTFTRVNFTLFETLEQCCDFWYFWQDGRNCYLNEEISASTSDENMMNTEPTMGTSAASPSPSVTEPDFYYPQDLTSGVCSNDDSQRPSNFDSLGFTLFVTLEQCCDFWFGWKTDGSCLSNTPVDPSVGSVSGPPVASPGESGEGNVFSDSVEDEFYLVNDTCYSASNGMMDGKLYENRESCCNAISEMEQRHKCLWNQQTGGSPSSGGQPAPDDSPPRSASQLAKGSFLVFIFVRCLSLIFIS